MTYSTILPIEYIQVLHADAPITIIVKEIEAEFKLAFPTLKYKLLLNLLQYDTEVYLFAS